MRESAYRKILFLFKSVKILFERVPDYEFSRLAPVLVASIVFISWRGSAGKGFPEVVTDKAEENNYPENQIGLAEHFKSYTYLRVATQFSSFFGIFIA